MRDAIVHHAYHIIKYVIGVAVSYKASTYLMGGRCLHTELLPMLRHNVCLAIVHQLCRRLVYRNKNQNCSAQSLTHAMFVRS